MILENLKNFTRKHMKRSETAVLLQTFCLQYYENYPQLIFYSCILQDGWALKVVLGVQTILLTNSKNEH